MSSASVLAVQVPRAIRGGTAERRLDHMFRAHHELVWRVLRRLGMGPEAAADVTQQAYLIAAERLADIRAGSERAFLLGTAVRLARAAQRSLQRWKLQDDMELEPDPRMRVDELVERRRQIKLMDRILSVMDPELVTVFVLFEIEGWSTPDIAQAVGIPVGTAASRLRRAREVFRNGVAQFAAQAGREAKP